MLHSKSDEDLGKAEEVTKQVEFESSKIINIKSSLKHLMRLIKIFKSTINI